MMNKTVSCLKSAKRTKIEKKGIHAWHPYYAGYSEQFVFSAIEYLKLRSADLVLDPWSGSGITGYVCETQGICSIGFEINPVMSSFACAKSGFVIEQLDKYGTVLLDKIINLTKNINREFAYDDELNNFMSSSLTENILRLKQAIYICEYPEISQSVISICGSTNLAQIHNSLKAFFLCALFITARKLSGYKKGSNPTWFKKIEIKQDFDLEQVNCTFANICAEMHDDLKESPLIPSNQIYHYDFVADSRNISLKQNSIDAVITSPPYLTRIDYAMSTQLELLIVKDSKYLRNLRLNTMGSTVITSKKIQVSDIWGNTCVEILNKVKNHDSKASKTYYWKNLIQYFDDAYTILLQIHQVLKPGKSALLVVQSSYYKDIEIPLNKIYAEMASSIGFSKTCEPFTEVIKGHMAHVNTKSSIYKKNKVYYESVIELIK